MRGSAAALVFALAALPLAGCLDGGLVGSPAPAFDLLLSDGSRMNETTHLGKFVVLDLMATWCAPCKLEVDHLRDVQRAFGDRVVIVSIGADPTETDAQLDQFARDEGATWPHGLDRDGSIGRAYRLGIIPKLVVIDPQGTVVFERQGEVLPTAIARVIDPASPLREDRPASTLFALSCLAAVVGFLAVLNPYRRLHRDGVRPAGWIALALFALLALVAWRFSGLVSTRATYGSLALGAISLGAVAWWTAARKKPAGKEGAHPALQAFDRAYEAAPHFALALVMGLDSIGAAAFFAPLAAFLVGYAAGTWARAKVPPDTATKAGLVGLALAAAGLLVFGSRILAA